MYKEKAKIMKRGTGVCLPISVTLKNIMNFDVGQEIEIEVNPDKNKLIATLNPKKDK